MEQPKNTTASKEDVSTQQELSLKYKSHLEKIKQKVVALFDAMIACDITQPKDKVLAGKIYQRIEVYVKAVYNRYLGGQSQQKKANPKRKLMLEDLRVAVDKLKDLKNEVFDGKKIKNLGFQGPGSYLAETSEDGLVLTKGGCQLYSGKTDPALSGQSIQDIVFIPPLSSYFLAYEDQLYRKDLDDKPPYHFMDVNCIGRHGASLRYSKTQEKLIINKDSQQILVIDPKTKETEVVLKKNVGNTIMDLSLIGKEENRVVSVTRDGHFQLHSLAKDSNGEQISHYEIELIKERDEWCESIAVSHCNEYLLLGTSRGGDVERGSSRILSFKLIENKFVQTNSIDESKEKIGPKRALEWSGSSEEFIWWVSMSMLEDGLVQLYGYHKETGTFREMKTQRVRHQEHLPTKITRINDELYYTGVLGKLMNLRVWFT